VVVPHATGGAVGGLGAGDARGGGTRGGGEAAETDMPASSSATGSLVDAAGATTMERCSESSAPPGAVGGEAPSALAIGPLSAVAGGGSTMNSVTLRGGVSVSTARFGGDETRSRVAPNTARGASTPNARATTTSETRKGIAEAMHGSSAKAEPTLHLTEIRDERT
jgi:hypothetical protein